MDGGSDADDVGEDIPGYAAIDVVDIPPGRVGVAHVTYHVAPEEHVLGAVELAPGRFPAALGIGPAAPFHQIVFYQCVGGPHPRNTLDSAVAHDVAPNDM